MIEMIIGMVTSVRLPQAFIPWSRSALWLANRTVGLLRCSYQRILIGRRPTVWYDTRGVSDTGHLSWLDGFMSALFWWTESYTAELIDSELATNDCESTDQVQQPSGRTTDTFVGHVRPKNTNTSKLEPQIQV